MNELFQPELIKIIAPIAIVQLILMITALVSCIRQEQTRGPKWMWVLIILFANLIGPIVYFIIGRRSQ